MCADFKYALLEPSIVGKTNCSLNSTNTTCGKFLNVLYSLVRKSVQMSSDYFQNFILNYLFILWVKYLLHLFNFKTRLNCIILRHNTSTILPLRNRFANRTNPSQTDSCKNTWLNFKIKIYNRNKLFSRNTFTLPYTFPVFPPPKKKIYIFFFYL